MSTYARMVADSISPSGVRLSTMEVRTRRFMLPEFNTHRAFSRNSASSRAIPLKKMLERARNSAAFPAEFPREQKGMQGGEAISGGDLAYAEKVWRSAAAHAANGAWELGQIGVHKSVANRLLEPFLWHTIVVTSTEWENFFEQRCSPLAQPEIRELAELMRDAMEESEPQNVRAGEWHLPYVGDDEETLDALAGAVDAPAPWHLCVQVSAARCARVSYLTQDGRRDVSEDLALYRRLVSAKPGHWSPFEHVATPWAANHGGNIAIDDPEFPGLQDALARRPAVGNLLGWRSARLTMEIGGTFD